MSGDERGQGEAGPGSWAGGHPLRGSDYLRKRRVRLLLHGNRSLEGLMHVADGQSVIGFLDTRRFFLNLTSARWLDGRGPDSELPHLSVRVSQIVWLVPLDPSLPLSSAIQPTNQSREVELELVGDIALRVNLHIAHEQRMSDYFDSNPAFVPLRSAKVGRGGETIERLAVNHRSILTIRET